MNFRIKTRDYQTAMAYAKVFRSLIEKKDPNKLVGFVRFETGGMKSRFFDRLNEAFVSSMIGKVVEEFEDFTPEEAERIGRFGIDRLSSEAEQLYGIEKQLDLKAQDVPLVMLVQNAVFHRTGYLGAMGHWAPLMAEGPARPINALVHADYPIELAESFLHGFYGGRPYVLETFSDVEDGFTRLDRDKPSFLFTVDVHPTRAFLHSRYRSIDTLVNTTTSIVLDTKTADPRRQVVWAGNMIFSNEITNLENEGKAWAVRYRFGFDETKYRKFMAAEAKKAKAGEAS